MENLYGVKFEYLNCNGEWVYKELTKDGNGMCFEEAKRQKEAMKHCSFTIRNVFIFSMD